MQRWPAAFERVAAEMGFDLDADARAARMLRDLLPAGSERGWAHLASLLRGRRCRVFGAGPSLERLDREAIARGADVLIAADGATSFLLERGVVPHVVVTDLDGRVPDQLAAGARGALLCVHAHGDNMPALARWVPRMAGPVVATGQVEGVAGVAYVGGFTDGDRAAHLAARFGARLVEHVGLDFRGPIGRYSFKEDSPRKRRKLAVAERLLAELAARHRVVRLEPTAP